MAPWEGIAGVPDFLILVIEVGSLGRKSLFLHLLPFPPLFLVKELLYLQHHPYVEVMPIQVANSGTSVAAVPGVPRVPLETVETFPSG